MTDDLDFLRALIARPEDNPLRLAYADWLESRSDPRGLFLRWEVALNESDPDARPGDLVERLHQARSKLDARWLAMIDRPQPSWRIFRTKPAPKSHGKAIPAFIHNCDVYFLSTIDVFADGAINCWGFVDLPLFRDKLARGWVVPRAAVGSELSIHNLGSARVGAAEWDRSPEDLEREVTEALRELNPTMEGLLDMEGSDTEVRGELRYAKLGLADSKPYRVSPSGDEIPGAELPVLEVVECGYRLRPWLIYADGLSQLGSANELLPVEAVARMFKERRLRLSAPSGAWVILDGLGRFRADKGYWSIRPGERTREAFDLLDQLNGRPGAIRRCIDAHLAYESDPSRERRETLREAYEGVPEHLRMFCGDMDSKDGPIRRILSEDWPD
ncbi:DUF7638 domain-containing protein [Tundrisphaera lichenicola]|uniref:DUF7638 domain-containing protein n=1 Tax=Tundrisphaera lichenicola TaxID=2029860 RepID=UPI003EBD6DC8